MPTLFSSKKRHTDVLLKAVTSTLQDVQEGTFVAAQVGRIITELADLEW